MTVYHLRPAYDCPPESTGPTLDAALDRAIKRYRIPPLMEDRPAIKKRYKHHNERLVYVARCDPSGRARCRRAAYDALPADVLAARYLGGTERWHVFAARVEVLIR